MQEAKNLLQKAIFTLENRNESYGSANVVLENLAKRWSLTLGIEVSAAQVVLCLIDLKLARLNSNIKHEDSIVDIAGYAGLLAGVLDNNIVEE